MQTARNPRGLRFLPKVTFITTVGLISAAIAYQASAQNVYTTPVGFQTVPTGASGQFSSFALPFQQLANDQGLVTAISSPSNVTVACASCATANYANATSLNYLQFETGAAVGRFYAISAQDSSGDITLSTGSDNLQTIGVAANDTYSIHPYWRIQDVFGTPATTTLYASNNASHADNVLVWNGSAWVTYFPIKGGSWSPSGTAPLSPDESILIVHRPATGTNVVTIGGVRTTNLVSLLSPGYNLMGNSFPASTTISNLNLLQSGFLGSNNSAHADNVLVWNGVSWDTLFYITTSHSWSPSNNYPITATSTYFIDLKHGVGIDWQRPLPYSP